MAKSIKFNDKKLIEIISDSSQLLTDESYKEINQKTFRDEKFLDKLIEIILDCLTTANYKHDHTQILKCLTLLNYLIVNGHNRITSYFKSKLNSIHKLKSYQGRNSKKIRKSASQTVQLLNGQTSNGDNTTERYIIVDGSNVAIKYKNPFYICYYRPGNQFFRFSWRSSGIS